MISEIIFKEVNRLLLGLLLVLFTVSAVCSKQFSTRSQKSQVNKLILLLKALQ